MSEKRYYWLKLPNTYFSQLEQKKMRKQEHGKDMQVIYLRMLLLSFVMAASIIRACITPLRKNWQKNLTRM